MPKFVLKRGFNLVGKGHNIRFEKDVEVYVPPELARDAIAIGAECVDEEIDVLGPESEAGKALTEEDRRAMLFAAFDELIAKNDAADFGADGRPSVAALKAICGFNVSKKERDAALTAYREAEGQ